MKVSTVEEMRRLDRTAIEKYGIAEQLLMENAGEAAYFAIRERMRLDGRRCVVFCGVGNNGGDGFVVARKIHSNGGKVKIFILADPERFKGAAGLNHEIAVRLGIEMESLASAEAAQADLAHAHLIVDAIFGTGLTRDVEGRHREVVELINRYGTGGRIVCSLDIPSGVQGDTGSVMGVAVRADFTVTFGLPKIGNLLFPGYRHCGKLYVTHISFPPELYQDDALKIALNHPPRLSARNPDGHKGTFGDALCIAGAAGYYGAPYFAALAFMKAGGGYARLASPESITPFLANKGSEIVFAPQQETAAGSLALANKTALLELAAKVDLVIMGPGLSLEQQTGQLVRELTAEIPRPLLLDGDGITAVCEDLSIVAGRKAPTVLTPHLGEMSRITGEPIAKIAAEKIAVLRRVADELNAVVVLKGAHSLIGFPDGRVFINLSGNSGMATAGSGDVLAGAIGAMFGLGLPLPEAVCKGVFIHGLAGDIAAQDCGEDGLTAQDLLNYLPRALKMDREGICEALRERYAGAQVL